MSRRRGCRGGQGRDTSPAAFDTTIIERRFGEAIAYRPDSSEEIHVDFIAEGRRLVRGRRGDERARVIAGLHAIDRIHSLASMRRTVPATEAA